MIERSRGTGPRATVSKQTPLHRRAGACPPPCLCCGGRSRGTGPRATVIGAFFSVVCDRLIAIGSGSLGKYARALNDLDLQEEELSYRRAGACPPPCLCCGESSRRTGPRATGIERSRGTGPRATVVGAFLCRDREVSPTAGPRPTVKSSFFRKKTHKSVKIVF